MSSKYIHNISGEANTYQGIEIDNNSFYQIPENLLIEFQNESNLLTDLLAGNVRMSSDGITDYSTTPITNFNFLRNEHYQVDEEGRQITRTAAGKAGWVYFAHPIEFETAKIGSLYEKDKSGSSRGISTIKFYDVNDAEITDAQYEANIVKTVILFKPSYDYELIAGNIQQIDSPSTDIRLWVIGGLIELGGAYVKEFAGGLNMRYYGANESVKTDGRAAKYMKKDIDGVPYQANQLQIIVKHNAGVQHRLMLTLEYFRA